MLLACEIAVSVLGPYKLKTHQRQDVYMYGFYRSLENKSCERVDKLWRLLD